MLTASYAEIVKELKIEGNNRISKETIIVFGDIQISEDYNNQKINDLIKKLYETNFFSYIEVNLNNGILNISLKENPIIQNLTFKGIKAKKFREPILERIELKEKSSFVENYLTLDIQNIKNVFRNQGYYFVKVEAFKTQNPNNTIDLIYEIDLGERAKIGKIQFTGDKKFKDSKLRNVITSEETKFWKFISNKKFLNEERISLDARLLKNYYKNKGYYQVEVNTTNVTYEQGEGFLLTYNITAGTRFIIEDFSFKIPDTLNKKHFTEVEKMASKIKNKYYSPRKIRKILDKLNNLTSKKDLQFMKSEVSELIKEDRLKIIINVYEGEQMFVERINITGNSVTNDTVIRGELALDEGDPYSLLLLNKSINNLKGRRIFGSVNQKVTQGSSYDLKIIDIEVEETATGEITAGAGIGTSGGTIGFGVKESNFVGSGVKLDANLAVSEESIRGKFSVINPNYNYSGNLLRATIESTKITKMSDFGYDSSKTGFNFGTTFEQYEDVYFSPSISSYFESLKTNASATKKLKQQEGNYFDVDFRYSLIKDKRDQVFQTTEGYRISFNQSLPLYSENRAILNGFDYVTFHTFNENVIGSVRFFSRAINSVSDGDVKISDRMYIPSKLIRGFEPGKIGPVDSGDFVGGNYAAALGFTAALPNLLPAFSNLDISVFLDTANVWGVDYDDTIDDASKIRSAFGVSVDWFTPAGPLNFSLSQDLSKLDTDKSESFRFNIGTTF